MKKVMVVDDDKEFLSEITEVLKMTGYDTTAFSHGEEAIESIPLEKPDIILLDLKMSGGSGFKFADEIKSLSEAEHIPIIAVTGVYTQEEHVFPIKVCGFKKRLIKPVNPLDLIMAIEQFVGK